MSRPLRIEYQGAYYHIFSRGNRRQSIFRSDTDRNTFLETLERMSDRFKVDIFAFVLMDNHYHLLLRTNQPNLSKAMQWLGTTYTTIFNLRHAQTGHLFQGRYKSILVENEPYLIQLSCYIHRNPLRAGMVQRLIDYPWSSYPAYAYKWPYYPWLHTELILSQFAPESSQCSAYREKVQRYADESKTIWEDVKHGAIYGSEGFVDQIKKQYLDKEDQELLPVQIKNVHKPKLCDIIDSASVELKADIETWKNSRRILKADVRSRDMLVYLLWQSGRFSNSEIGSQVGLTISSVSRRVGIFQEMLQDDPKLRQDYARFKSIIKG